MNMPNATSQPILKTVLLACGGLLLVGLGVQQLMLGWHKRPLPSVETAVPVAADAIPVVDVQQGYELRFDGQRQRWVMASTDGRTEALLPAGMPQPPAFEMPARAMSLQQWAQTLEMAREDSRLPLNQATLRALRAFDIAGKKPFKNLKGGDSSSVSKEEKIKPKPATIPAAFNPKTRAFEEEMLAWQREVRNRLRASRVEREGYRVDSTHPFIGTRTSLMFTSIARNRVLSRDFGRKRQDILIYLQVICNFHRIYIKVDGVTGPQTRRSLQEFANLVLPGGQVRNEYLALLRPWIGS